MGVGVFEAAGIFEQFPRHAADRQPFKFRAGGGADGDVDEVGDRHDRRLRQFRKIAPDRLGCPVAGGQRGGASPDCGNAVELEPDRFGIRLMGVRADDAGTAENRNSLRHAECRVQRLLRQLFAAGDRYGQRQFLTRRPAESGAFQIVRQNPARTGIDRREADRHREAGPGHPSHARAAVDQ
ncbi:hypothetical protein SDC9_129791 [bioreactor metagenome]|uniref:Uncharacterized protein n=1 Tax=bioreactor metagenome TaxID=1076179 RepID=A0A645D0N5_9ZZZZ